MGAKRWRQLRTAMSADSAAFGDECDELLSETALSISDRPADCCVGQSTYRVVLPATDDRPYAAELLLCGHHYRNSHDTLAGKQAAVFDADNLRIA